MSQRTRSLVTLLVLLAVAGGVGAFAYYGVHQKQEEEKAAKEKKEKLFGEVDKAKIKHLTVTAKGQTTVLAAKQGGGWEVVSPLAAEAEKATVDSLLDRLVGLKSKMVVEEKATDLARYGLDNPSIKVVAKVEGGSDLVLRSGAENSFDSSVYVATGDSNDIIQAEGGFKWALEKDTFDLREKRVVPFEDAQVSELDVSADGTRYALKKSAGKWELAAPIADKADEQTVNRVLGGLRNLRATKFVTDTVGPDDAKTYGFAPQPRLTAAVTLEGGARMTLLAGQAEGADKVKKTYARRQEASFVAEVPDSIFNELNVKLADLRDKTVIAVDRNKVQGVKFAMGGETLTLERSKATTDAGTPSEDWKLTGDKPAEAKKWKMSSLLWMTNSLRATSLADENPKDLAAYGLDKPAKSMTLLDEADKELGTLLVGKEDGNDVFLKSAADKRVFKVEKSRVQDLPNSRADLEEPPKADTSAAN